MNAKRDVRHTAVKALEEDTRPVGAHHLRHEFQIANDLQDASGTSNDCQSGGPIHYSSDNICTANLEVLREFQFQELLGGTEEEASSPALTLPMGDRLPGRTTWSEPE